MKLPAGLIVSCQARADNPLHGPQFMGAMALAARDGGAVAIRANGSDDIRAVKAAGLPVIGIHKLFSGLTLSAAPIILIYIVLSKQFIAGMTSGAVK